MIAIRYRHPGAFGELLRYDEMMKAVALDDVRRAAARWLKAEPLVAVALPARPAGAGGAKTGTAPAR